jgi:hypothetical protein
MNVILLVTLPTLLITDSSKKDSAVTGNGVDERFLVARNSPVMA